MPARFSSKKVALAAIRWYQHTWSPDHSPRKALYPYGYCRFSPTCSDYTYQAVEKYGILQGSWKGFLRILRCNPWSKPGPDPLT